MQIVNEQVLRRGQVAVAGDVTKKVNSAEFRIDLPKQLRDGVRVGDIRAGDDDLSSKCPDGHGSRFGTFEIPIDKNDVRTSLSHGDSGRLSQALSGSGNDGDFARQVKQ